MYNFSPIIRRSMAIKGARSLPVTWLAKNQATAWYNRIEGHRRVVNTSTARETVGAGDGSARGVQEECRGRGEKRMGRQKDKGTVNKIKDEREGSGPLEVEKERHAMKEYEEEYKTE